MTLKVTDLNASLSLDNRRKDKPGRKASESSL